MRRILSRVSGRVMIPIQRDENLIKLLEIQCNPARAKTRLHPNAICVPARSARAGWQKDPHIDRSLNEYHSQGSCLFHDDRHALGRSVNSGRIITIATVIGTTIAVTTGMLSTGNGDGATTCATRTGTAASGSTIGTTVCGGHREGTSGARWMVIMCLQRSPRA